MGYPSHEIERNSVGVSQGTQIRKENKESFESKVLKQKKHGIVVAVAVMIR